MKALKSLSILAMAALMYSCSSTGKKPEHKCIAPLPASIEVNNLKDCTVPAAFTPDSFNWMGGNLTMTVYNMDLYDVVDMEQMQVGDTIIYEGETKVINTINRENGIEINGGLEEGGCWLAPNEGGT